jgi:hypothetical protein
VLGALPCCLGETCFLGRVRGGDWKGEAKITNLCTWMEDYFRGDGECSMRMKEWSRDVGGGNWCENAPFSFWPFIRMSYWLGFCIWNFQSLIGSGI